MKKILSLVLVLLAFGFSPVSAQQPKVKIPQIDILDYSNLPSALSRSATIQLDSLNLANGYASHILFVDTPGTGHYIVPQLITLSFHGQGKTPYDISGIGGFPWEGLDLFWGNTSYPDGGLGLQTSLFTRTDDITVVLGEGDLLDLQILPDSTIDNKALYIGQLDTMKIKGGNATVTMTVDYLIKPIK